MKILQQRGSNFFRYRLESQQQCDSMYFFVGYVRYKEIACSWGMEGYRVIFPQPEMEYPCEPFFHMLPK